MATLTLNFPNPEDSPTKKPRANLFFRIDRTADGIPKPRLFFASTQSELTPDAFRAFAMSGARLTANTQLHQQRAAEALHIPFSDVELKP